jgi:hypothetical protein
MLGFFPRSPLGGRDTHDGGGRGNVGGPLFPEHYFKNLSKEKLNKKLAKVHREVPDKALLPPLIKDLEAKELQAKRNGEKEALRRKILLYKIYQEELQKEDEIILTILIQQ